MESATRRKLSRPNRSAGTEQGGPDPAAPVTNPVLNAGGQDLAGVVGIEQAKKFLTRSKAQTGSNSSK
jgi:hypothetical protein